MVLFSVKWFGRRPSSRSNRAKIKEMIKEYTSEHDEEYVVIGFMNESSNLTANQNYSSNVLFDFKNRLYLAVFTPVIVLIFPDTTLNIAVLISLYERTDIKKYEEMGFTYDLGCYLT